MRLLRKRPEQSELHPNDPKKIAAAYGLAMTILPATRYLLFAIL